MEPLRPIDTDRSPSPTAPSTSAHKNHNDASVDSPVEGAISPPYWQGENPNSPRPRAESESSLRSPQIQLQDHTQEDSEQYRACWAKSARIDSWVIVGSSAGLKSIGSYVVFNCLIETSNVSSDDRLI
jgi:hypothetical protein